MRVRGIRGFEGRLGIVREVVGEKCLLVWLFPGRNQTGVPQSSNKIKAKPKQLESVAYKSFLEQMGVGFYACRPFCITWTVQDDGGVEPATVEISKVLHGYSCPLSLPTIQVASEDLAARLACAQLSEGSFLFEFSERPDMARIDAFQDDDSSHFAGRALIQYRVSSHCIYRRIISELSEALSTSEQEILR
jgi:hypothetical protein